VATSSRLPDPAASFSPRRSRIPAAPRFRLEAIHRGLPLDSLLHNNPH
jgi:hypothetical protein